MATYTINAVRRRFDANFAPCAFDFRRTIALTSSGFSLSGGSINTPRGYSLPQQGGVFSLDPQAAPLTRALAIPQQAGVFAFGTGTLGLFKGYTSIASTGAFALGTTATPVLRSSLLPGDSGTFGLIGFPPALQRGLGVSFTAGSFSSTFAVIGFVERAPASPSGSIPRPPEPISLTGSSSFYAKFNTFQKARDLGAVDNLLGIFSGKIGSSTGANSVYFKLRTQGAADLRISKNPVNRYTDQALSVAILDADRKPLPLTDAGFAFLNEIEGTTASELDTQLPSGTYYLSVTSSLWQEIDFSITIQVFRYVELDGSASLTAVPTGRLPLIKIMGSSILTAPSAGTVLNPNQNRILTGSALATAVPSAALTIMRGSAVLQALPYGRLKQTHRLAGNATLQGSSRGTLTVTRPYGY